MSNLEILEEACEGIPSTKRSMFGGHGLFARNGGIFAAVVPGDRLAVKLPREDDLAAFLAEGGETWVYDGKMTMSKWAVVPESMYDEPTRLAEWVRLAHATAEPARAKVAKKAAAKAATKAPAKGAAAKKAKGPKR